MWSASILVVMVFPACGPSDDESLLIEQTTIIDELATALESCEDITSTRTASLKIRLLADRMRALRRRVHAQPETPPEAVERLHEKHKDAVESANERFKTQLDRVRKAPTLYPLVQPALEDFMKAMLTGATKPG